MDRTEALRRVSTEMVEAFTYIYNQLGNIKDEHARVRAANGMMVTLDKVLPFNAPKYDQPVPEFETADKMIGEPTTGKGEAPGKVQWTEEGLIGPAYDPAAKKWNYCPECKKTDIGHVSGPTAKYPGKGYQACFTCRMYLNADGSKKDMGPARPGAR